MVPLSSKTLKYISSYSSQVHCTTLCLHVHYIIKYNNAQLGFIVKDDTILVTDFHNVQK